MADESRIRVAVRVRPRLAHLNERYEVNCCRKVDGTTLVLSNPTDEKWAHVHKSTFTFNAVFDEEDTQQDVYQQAAQPLIDAVLDGGHATIFTYGQTGSGKTFTILGSVDEASTDLITPTSGIFLRALADLFDYKSRQLDQAHVVICLTIIEIYIEDIRDLLAAKRPLQLRMGRGGEEELPDATMRVVENIQMVYKIFREANQQRAVGQHRLNDVSSRSHAAFFLDVYQQEKTPDTPDPPSPTSPGFNLEADAKYPIRHSRVALVDLAGSERVKRSGVEGQQLKETQAINLSLTCLANVVSGLDQERQHVPYRDSKITRILKSSFVNPRSQILVITNVSPTTESFAETVSSIKFADRVKGLEGKANFTVGEEISDEHWYLQQLRELEMLCADIRVAGAMGHTMGQRGPAGKKQTVAAAIQEGRKRKEVGNVETEHRNRCVYNASLRAAVEAPEVLAAQEALEDKQEELKFQMEHIDTQNEIMLEECLAFPGYVEATTATTKQVSALRHQGKAALKDLRVRVEEQKASLSEVMTTFHQLCVEWETLEKNDLGTLSASPEVPPPAVPNMANGAPPHPQPTTGAIANQTPPPTDTSPSSHVGAEPPAVAERNVTPPRPPTDTPPTASTHETIYISVVSPHKAVTAPTSVEVPAAPQQAKLSPDVYPVPASDAVVDQGELERIKALRTRKDEIRPADAEHLVAKGRECLQSKALQFLITIISVISSLAEACAANRVTLAGHRVIALILDAMRMFPANHSLQGQSTAALLHLSREGVNLVQISSLGGIQCIVKTMATFPKNVSLLTVANAAMWSLATHKENKAVIAREGGIDMILTSMENFPESIDLLTRANAALCNLAANVDNTVLIAEKGGIDLILRSMQRFPEHSDLLTSANVALSNLAVNVNNNLLILHRGGVQLILQSMKNFPRHVGLLCRALAALCSMALTDDSKLKIANEGGLVLILSAMRTFSSHPVLLTKSNATLWNLSEHPHLKQMIIEGGGFELIKKSLTDFPDNHDLVKEATGALTSKKFVTSASA